jgi:hypothetical protein
MQKNTKNMCVCDSDERVHGVSDGVNDTMMSETL